MASGYEPVSTTELLEADLAAPEPRDPRAPLIRRQARIEVVEDAMPAHWWEALAIGGFRPTRFRLLSKADDLELARATTWDMSGWGHDDAAARIGLIGLEVHPEHRRKGFGRHLVGEILRHAREQMIASVAVQTRSTNLPALSLYESLGFAPAETATLYRLPAGSPRRLDPPEGARCHGHRFAPAGQRSRESNARILLSNVPWSVYAIPGRRPRQPPRPHDLRPWEPGTHVAFTRT